MIQTYLFARLLLFAYYIVRMYAISNAARESNELTGAGNQNLGDWDLVCTGVDD